MTIMRIARAALVLLIPLATYGSEITSDSNQLLTTTTDRVNIRSAGATPFQLDADFTAQFNVPQDGHVSEKWVAKDLWWQEITIGTFHQLNVRKGDTLYTSRNAPFTPLRVTELQDLLSVFSLAREENWQLKKAPSQAQGGVKGECIEIKYHASQHEWNPKRVLCVNQETKTVLSEETKDDQEYRRKEFADYQPFGERHYPRVLRLFVNGSAALRVKVNSLVEANFPQSLFTPPAEAIARRQCEHMVAPKAVKTPDPAYPRSSAENRMGGTATFALTILPDGSVDHVQLLETGGHEIDAVTQQIVRTWKFKPAMCGNEPVAYDIRVAVTFHIK